MSVIRAIEDTLPLFDGSDRAAAIDALHAATAVYTSTPVIQDLLDLLRWPQGDHCLLDPSCGDGQFLAEALGRLLDAFPDVDDRQLPSLLEGWEIHPFAAEQARIRLRRILVAHGWGAEVAANAARNLIRKADFLTAGPIHRQYHAIAGNPPYLRWANIPHLLRSEYAQVAPRYAQADLLHTFLDRCAKVLTTDGEIALVTADRWLFNCGSSVLRASLGEVLGIDHLQRLDPATTFYRPKNRRVGTPARVHPVSLVLRPSSQQSVRLSSEAVYPDAVLEIADATEGLARLGDVAQVRMGPWLGAHGIFVVDELDAQQLPSDCLVPAVDTKDVSAGRLQKATRWAIRTTADRAPTISVLEHLDSNLHRMALRGRRTPRWLPPETWTSMPLTMPSLMIPRIAKTCAAVPVPTGTLVMNHNLSITAAGDVPLEHIAREFQSDRSTQWLRTFARRLENGYFEISARLLRELPISTRRPPDTLHQDLQ